MAQHILSTTKILFDGNDFSGDLNSLTFRMAKDDAGGTAFGDTAHEHTPGMKSHELAVSGFANFGITESEGVFQGAMGTANKIITVMPQNSTVESVAYSCKGMALEMSLGGSVGELAAFSGAAYSQSTPAIRGVVGATGAKTETGAGASITLGAVGATQSLYGVLHCTAVSGTDTPTITCKIQSAPLATFLADVTDRITFSAVTATGAQWATAVAGPITDTFWRVSWVVSGTNPSLTIYAVLAIN